MPTATNDGARLAYERSGPPDADSVVFVEGLGYGRWMWRWQRAALGNYDTIVPDNRGTGDSDTPEGPYTIGEMAADLAAVLDDAGVDSAHVVGASMGGMIAQQFALDHGRAESLTLLCTTPGGPEAVPTPEETQQRIFDVPEEYDERERRRYKMAPAMTDTFVGEHDDLLERIVDWRIESDAGEQALAWQAAAVEAFDVHDRLGDITAPTLLVHGTADRVVPVENGRLLADGLPDVEYLELDGAPHLLFIERADAVNEALRGFLADV
ncbi:alpha/beta fold hydrolase [Haloarcula onubensis]|uniref:Alpha/beta hydrolase n=1 Tax=Haloarcula onubensis TaxID=2950539 RepID=A0ABU2FU20_9EURY|nr:alpha/beta hydrolase [Halomicroarcula sp. S3CR25-11]MDS0284250.1 alpha/beta hydrolase [Halomicroarcula sp. S3CR25-11]